MRRFELLKVETKRKPWVSCEYALDNEGCTNLAPYRVFLRLPIRGALVMSARFCPGHLALILTQMRTAAGLYHVDKGDGSHKPLCLLFKYPPPLLKRIKD